MRYESNATYSCDLVSMEWIFLTCCFMIQFNPILVWIFNMKVYINVKVRAHLFYSSQIAHFFVLLHNYYSWTWPSVWYVRTNKKLCKFPKNKINRVTLFMMLAIRLWKYNSTVCLNDFIIVLYQKLAPIT